MSSKKKYLLISILITLKCIAFRTEITSNVFNKRESVENVRSKRAEEMLKYMQLSEQPCDNFYNFTCGRWAEYHPIENDFYRMGVFDFLLQKYNEKVQEMLRRPSSKNSPLQIKLKQFYESCTKFADNTQQNIKDFYRIIAEFGEMPALRGTAWNASRFNWLETIGRIFYKYNVGALLVFTLYPDPTNNHIAGLMLDHAKSFRRSTYFYAKSVEVLIMRKSQILQKYLNISEEIAVKVANEIVSLEIQLAKGLPPNTTDKKNYRKITLNQLQMDYAPTIDMKSLFELSLGQIPKLTILENWPLYQRNLINVLKVTPKHVLANYIFYELIAYFIGIGGKQSKINCMHILKTHFFKQLDNLIYRDYNLGSMEGDIKLLWQDIKTAFTVTLNALDWMQSSTRKKALLKLNKMQLEIYSYDNENISDSMEKYAFNKSSFIGNCKKIFIEEGKAFRLKLQNCHKSNCFEYDEGILYSPMYLLAKNIVEFPVVLLQVNFLWHNAFPRALKFGFLGTIMAHELIHGFGELGRKYDENGNKKNWFDLETERNYMNRTACFAKQYAQYEYNNRAHLQVQTENIADNGGLRLSYNAYEKWLKVSKYNVQEYHSESLPHLNFTALQLFFISYGQLWCRNVLPNLYIEGDLHVSEDVRSFVTLMNFPAFAKAFNCPVGSFMNPLKKCSLF